MTYGGTLCHAMVKYHVRVQGGAVFPHEQCRRDEESGAFVSVAPFAVQDKVRVSCQSSEYLKMRI